MSVELICYIVIGIAMVILLNVNRIVDTRKFIQDSSGLFDKLMEDDYEFLLTVKYPGRNLDAYTLFQGRLRNGAIGAVLFMFLFLYVFDGQLNLIFVGIALGVGIVMFKMPYMQLKSYYRRNLEYINTMLPYYLKSLEILVQHYTVPVALSRSIETAPEVFKPGLRRLVARIDEGDSSVQPYIDFANEYPVRDSMRMMRLLYRLGLGSQQNKHDHVMMFSKTVSALQNKAREQKYQNRLDKMESQTLKMLVAAGGGTLGLILCAMMQMMDF